jgi:NAD(P)-dependent dehydrogenase (short-subunit alcohol dehydrogenase family)
MSTSFAGKVVIVTGANSGIGESAAVALQEAGATVYGIARRKEAVEAMRSKHPKVKWLLADVSKADQIKSAIESVAKEAGRIDVLVNNAAIFAVGPLEAMTEEIVRSQFEINVFGTTFATQAALPALKLSKGSIINLSSAAGHRPAAGAAHYGATKAAVESLTRSWALELAPHGVRVNAIAPGPTDTPVFGKVPGVPADALKAMFVQKVPLGRISAAAEVTHWLVAMADPSVTFMTGHVLDIDGGMSLM